MAAGPGVAGVAVDNVGSDMGKMAPMNDALAAAYGQRPAEHLADGGFARLDGGVVIDQTDVGPAHRRALLGSFVAPGAGFCDGLLAELKRNSEGP